MPVLIDARADALGLLLAGAIGFLVGWTREDEGRKTARPGLRDFVIIALLGALGARVGELALTLGLAGLMGAVLLVARWCANEPRGVTTELAALLTFLLGYMSLTPYQAVAAALGIALTVLLVRKEELHRFARQTISPREFDDTLKFLALIFIIYPLLPSGEYGPFGFFEPRKIWLFVILVCGVSYVGYFLGRFLDPQRGVLLTAVVGGLASTTAYTGGVAKAVREAPEQALPLARGALVANVVQLPRVLLLLGLLSPPLAEAALPVFGGMTLIGLAAAWGLGRAGGPGLAHGPAGAFKNPFALRPALRFGLVFAAVLFLTGAGGAWLGQGGRLASAALGGLLDVDAVLFSMCGAFNRAEVDAGQVVTAVLLAAGANALFKSVLAASSGVAGFYLRVIAGFALMFGGGALLRMAFGG